MSETLFISSKNVLLPDGIVPATIAITSGKISAVAKERIPSTKAQPVRDAGESLIMPGLIDFNVRMDEPFRGDWEGFEHGTAAAAAGGFTSLVDIPAGSSNPVSSIEYLKKKIQSADGRLTVNCGFWGDLRPENTNDLAALSKTGITGFFFSMENSAAEDFPAMSSEEFANAAAYINGCELPFVAQSRISSRKKSTLIKLKDRYSYSSFSANYPASTEDDGIRQLIEIARLHHLRLHVLNISSSGALSDIHKAKESGVAISTSTCPHYLFFNAAQIPDQDPRYLCEPPIRDADNNKALWDALCAGEIDMITSGHRPCPTEMKHLEDGDLQAAVPGISSLQFNLPIVWTLAQRQGIPIERVAHWMSKGPADFLGLDTKGLIMEGYDADLTVWSPNKKIKVNSNTIRSKHKHTPYEGHMLSGIVQETWVGGKLVYDRGAFPETTAGKVLLRSF